MTTVLTWLTCIFLAAQGLHYVGYPVLLLILAKLRPRPAIRSDILPPVTLVIAAYNEAAVIAEKLENSLALDYPGLQVILTSDGSTDATLPLAQRFAASGVTVLHNPERRGKAAAVNDALAHATGEIVVFSDANSMYRSDAIRKLTRNFADPQVGCVGGQLAVRPPAPDDPSEGVPVERLYWRYESLIKRLESRVASTVGVAGSMLAVRRALVGPLPRGLINDDAYLGLSVLRRGYRVIYEPEAVGLEAPIETMRDEIVRRQRIAAGRYQLLLSLGWWPWNRPGALLMLLAHKVMRLLLPFLMIGALVANAALLAWPPVPAAMQIVLALQFAFYCLAAVGFLAEHFGRRWRIPAVAYYVIVGNLGSLRGFLRYVTGRQTAIWRKATR